MKPAFKGTMTSLSILKEYKGDLAQYEVGIDNQQAQVEGNRGMTTKLYGNVPQELRNGGLGSNVVIWVNNGKANLAPDSGAGNGGSGYNQQPQQQQYNQPTQQQSAPAKTYTKPANKDNATQERITNDASVNKAIECVKIALQADATMPMEKSKNGEEPTRKAGMTVGLRKKLCDPEYVASYVVEMAGDIAEAVRNGEVGKPLPKFLEEKPLED